MSGGDRPDRTLTLRRLFAYIRNDISTAEALDIERLTEEPAWLARAATDPDLADYAVEAARRSSDWAEDGVRQLQAKAASHLTLTIGLLPFALGATLVSLPQAVSAAWRMVPFILFAAGDALMLLSAVMAGLATGLVASIGTNIARFEKPPGALANSPLSEQLAGLKAAEAAAWHGSSWLAEQVSVRVGRDLFSARRYLLLSLAIFGVAIVVLVVAVDGDVASIFRASPVASQHP